MSDQKQPVITEEKPTQPAINEKRRRAMVWYLLSMFLVAAILVAVSLFVQNRNLKIRDTENDTNSRDLQGRIEILQEEERVLRVTLAEHLLRDAEEAFEAANAEKFNAVMAELEAYADALSSDKKEIYEAIKASEFPESGEETTETSEN